MWDGHGSFALESDRGDTPTLSINNVSKLEGGDGDGTAFDFTVTLSTASASFSVDAATANGTATSGEDYGPINKQTLNFTGNAGETKNVSVLVLGDTKDEPDETFKVQLSNVQGSGNIPANNNLPVGVGTIQNDDGGGGDSLEISDQARSFAAHGYSGSEIKVRGSGTWNASTSDSWIQIESAKEKDDGSLFYGVFSNKTGFNRSASVRIGSQTHTVSQTSAISEEVAIACVCSAPTPSIGGIPSWTLFPIASDIDGIPLDDQFLYGLSIKDDYNDSSNRNNSSQNQPPSPAAGGFADGRADSRRAKGLDEIHVLAPEYRGAARGPWVQQYNSRGKRSLNLFTGPKFPGLQLLRIDTEGNGKPEPVVLGNQGSGTTELQLRSSSGALQDRKSVTPARSTAARLMNLEHDGKRGQEIGIAYVAKNGTGQLAIWDRSGKKLRKLAEHTVVGAKSANHQWMPLDIDDDGRHEMVVGYSAPSGKGATLRVVDPRTGETLVNKTVLKTGFDQAVWMPGDFDPDRSGAELLVGYRKKSKGFFKVLATSGAVLSTSKSIAAKSLHGWGAIQSKPGPKGTVRDLVVVAFTRANGDAAFDFDGDGDNGWEIVVVSRHVGDGNIGFQMFGRDGRQRGDRVQVFDGTYINPSASPIVFARKGRVDLSLMARQVGSQPEVQVWNVNGGVLLKKIAVLSKDVE